MLIEKKGYCFLKILVQPRASKGGIVGIHGETLKIKVTSPPVKGAANKECIEVLSKVLGIKKSGIEIIEGETFRRKTLKIEMPLEDIKHVLKRIVKGYEG